MTLLADQIAGLWTQTRGFSMTKGLDDFLVRVGGVIFIANLRCCKMGGMWRYLKIGFDACSG